jgi:TPR repeat protein
VKLHVVLVASLVALGGCGSAVVAPQPAASPRVARSAEDLCPAGAHMDPKAGCVADAGAPIEGRDPKELARFFASGASSLGVLYMNGAGVPKDEARGAALFAAACDAGDMSACANLGIATFEGQGTLQEGLRQERRAGVRSPHEARRAASMNARTFARSFTPALPGTSTPLATSTQ